MKLSFAKAAMMLSSLVLLSGCEKDTLNDFQSIPEHAIMLTTEGFSGDNEKTSVSGTSVQWDGGSTETVRINGNDYEVIVSDGKAYIDPGTPISGSAVYGYYPNDIVAADGWETTTPTVTIPDVYNCHYTDGRQVIALPMVAYATTIDDAIEFKHLTAAVNVMVWNATGTDLYVDRVVVTVAGHRLHGDISLNFENANYGIANSYDDPSDEADSSVIVTFPSSGDGCLVIEPGESNAKGIQVPILPVTNNREMTIEIYTHASGATWHKYIFSHHATLPSGLTRNKMLTARCKIHTGGGSHAVDNSFTINNNQKILFSLGNLQYIGSAATPYWKFAEHQYDILSRDPQV